MADRPEDGMAPAVGGMRASDADRDRVVDVLQTAFAQGRLTRDELAARMARTLASRTWAELATVTAALPEVGAATRRTGRKVAVRAAAAIVAAAMVAAFFTYYGGFIVLFVLAFVAATVTAAPSGAERRRR